ncbi:3-dehydroquinate synthase [Crocinitomix algicola]|uniref:3-dehydroquinate synthase n=1 Tax=Crocinitomix algicola TaxID=1740263 RepID=UPI0008727136|nr:3-dehydroquinate synthase [Crocinitomix algicola]
MNTLNYNNSEIRFGALSDSGFNDLISTGRFKNAKKIIFTDEHIYDLWIEHFILENDSLREAEIIQVPAGESSKSIEICLQLWETLSAYEIGRSDLIINIGGGMITDLGGFVASTYKRGIPFINVPTSLLAQVDASVGGKTGVDLGPFKNQIGVFADADFVFIDTNFLTTLPEEEIKSGYAEMLKHGLIAYKSYWEDLTRINPVSQSNKLLDRIKTSVAIKRDIVVEDHKEEGKRKILNFGHTIGHAVEGFFISQNKAIPHGFAVAAGLLTESYISMQKKFITPNDFDQIKNGLNELFELPLVKEADFPAILNLMLNDKKNTTSGINFTLLKGIGNGSYNHIVPIEEIIPALQLLVK